MSFVVTKLLGLALLAASILNIHALATGSIVEMSPHADPKVLACVAAFEWMFGLWLMSGLLPHLTWWVSIGYFTLLLDVSLSKALAGNDSCGCFGSIPVSPWATFAFDCAAVIALLVAQPEGKAFNPRFPTRLRLVVLAIFAVAGVLLGYVAICRTLKPAHLDTSGDVVGDAPIVALQPEAWIGQPFPLAKHIDLGDQFQRGSWLLLLYHRDCPACQPAVARFVGLAYEFASQRNGPRLALVEVPPYDRARPETIAQGTRCARARLSDSKQWQVTTPVFLSVKSGIVEMVSRSPESLSPEGEATLSPETGLGYLFPNYSVIRRQLFQRHIACGPLALIASLQDLGISLDPDQIESLLTEAGSQGIDMLRLKELAEKHKLHALGVAVSTDELRTIGRHAIAYLDGQGFVAVTGYLDDGLRVIDALKPSGVMPDDLFERSFGKPGYALLLSRSPLSAKQIGLSLQSTEAAPRGPHLRLSRNAFAVGRTHRRNWESTLSLANDGTQALEITDVKPCCADITASVDHKTVVPGRSTVLHANGRQGLLGPFVYHIELLTNQKDKPSVRVPVRGYLERPFSFDPPVVSARGLLPGEAARRHVVLDVSSDVDPDHAIVVVPPKDKPRLTAHVRRRDDGQPILAVDWWGAAVPGCYHSIIGVKAGPSDDAVVAELPAVFEVVPELEFFPPSLSVSKDELRRSWSRQLTIKFRKDFVAPNTVTWAHPGFADRIPVRYSRVGNDLKVSLSAKTVNGDRSALPEAAELIVVLPGKGTYKVPVYLGRVGSADW